jgi:hypothetical protein
MKRIFDFGESHCWYAAKLCVVAYQQSMEYFISIVGTPMHISNLDTNNGVNGVKILKNKTEIW